MKNLKYTILAIIFFSANFGFSQPGKIEKAKKYYESYSYSESIKRYEEITDKTPGIKRELAESYFFTGNYQKSEQYYSDLVTLPEHTSEDIYNYASVLKTNGKYEESENWMKKYYETQKNDSRVKVYVENPEYYKNLLVDKGKFLIKNLNINTEQEDFGTSFFDNKIIYASSSNSLKPIKRIWNWNNLPFLDLMVAETDSSMQFVKINPFREKLNKKYHEGPASFNKDFTFMAFTRNNYDGKSSDNIVKLQLFTSELKDNKWQTAVPMHFNSKEYSVGHASLSPDGKTIIFASDMPGGFGGVDLYVIYRNSDGTWTDPKNLGKTVNTEGNEMFPFFHPENLLFFASNGHPGLGGLDIFVTDIKDIISPSIPENIGIPANSSYDDFAFILDNEQKSGYFSSNRITGHGDDDIYMFKLFSPFTFPKILRGTATDSKGNILTNVEVILYDDKGNIVGKSITTEDGKYKFNIDKNIVYNLTGNKQKYSEGKNTGDATGTEREIISDLILDPTPEFSLYCLISDEKTKMPLDSVEIILTNNISGEKETIITEKPGDFLRQLTENKLNDFISYSLSLKRKGYLSENFNYTKTLDHPGQYNMHEDLGIVMNKIEIGTDLGKLVKVNPIYFDLDKSNIRPDAAIELDKIVKVMNEYPTMVIELGSHTDCRGSASYNMSLSDRRSKASAEYIKQRIPNPSRIYGKGYGESKLVNHCECEGQKKVPCSEEEHQANRRTEFKIIKVE
jgi:outer membrane protein OmpA-like peptidoglycan-associated protein